MIDVFFSKFKQNDSFYAILDSYIIMELMYKFSIPYR